MRAGTVTVWVTCRSGADCTLPDLPPRTGAVRLGQLVGPTTPLPQRCHPAAQHVTGPASANDTRPRPRRPCDSVRSVQRRHLGLQQVVQVDQVALPLPGMNHRLQTSCATLSTRTHWCCTISPFSPQTAGCSRRKPWFVGPTPRRAYWALTPSWPVPSKPILRSSSTGGCCTPPPDKPPAGLRVRTGLCP